MKYAPFLFLFVFTLGFATKDDITFSKAAITYDPSFWSCIFIEPTVDEFLRTNRKHKVKLKGPGAESLLANIDRFKLAEIPNEPAPRIVIAYSKQNRKGIIIIGQGSTLQHDGKNYQYSGELLQHLNKYTNSIY